MFFLICRRHVPWIVGALFLCAVPVLAANPSSPVPDYQRLLTYIKGQNLEEPLVLLYDSQGEFDQRLNKENIAYLNQNKRLLEQIQTRLAAERLEWKLAGSSKRLLVVTEKRPEYADLFEHYCHAAVSFILERTGLPNPYLRITTMQEPLTLPDTPSCEGITAYIVHNIAEEYFEEYLFSTPEGSADKIKIKLSNRVFSGKIGSYSSKLTVGQNSTVAFVREPYTLWQNTAQNPINVLVAPVEETLHISLRPATEGAIRGRIAQIQPKSMDELQQVVNEWIAVEEAIVGGLVARLMPELFTHLISQGLEQEMAVSLTQRDGNAQYRYLRQGIRVVSDLGVKPAITLYTAEPQQFKNLISPPEMAAK
jgi:hypothetical protein